MGKVLQILSFIFWLIRSFLSIWVHLGVRLIYGNQKFRLPPITNQLLLQPATVLAKRIRQRQVHYFRKYNIFFCKRKITLLFFFVQITSVDIVRACIDRIKAIQPHLNVYVDERFSQALIEAQEIDRVLNAAIFEHKSLPYEWSEEQAPFLGVPFSIKESMQYPGFHNSTGIQARKDFISNETATSVAHMLKSGAILLCNTNVSEGCMWFEA